MGYKELQISFEGRGEVRGYAFTQEKSSDAGYVYCVRDEWGGEHYEVFRRKINTQFGCVSYPTSKSFGIWAWCIRDRDAAMRRYDEMCVEYAEKCALVK